MFKPFVYAAALDSAITGGSAVYTLANTVDDSPTTFWFSGKPYQPANFRGEHFGVMTFRQALAKSDNVAAVHVAQEVGYGKVVAMARRFGLNDGIRATPAIALGAYQVTPLEIAAAYTAFANGGVRVKPMVISRATKSISGAGSASQLADGEHAGGSDAVGHGGFGPKPRIHAARRGEDRDVARWMVRGIHVAIVVRGLGGVRRLP